MDRSRRRRISLVNKIGFIYTIIIAMQRVSEKEWEIVFRKCRNSIPTKPNHNR